jgi:PTH1 family peptidyl-tRNA hydrolase
LAQKHQAIFGTQKLADVCEFNLKGKKVIGIKPNTYMNLSGKALRYWMNEHKIDLKNILVIVDDLAIPFGKLRIRANGSDAGHNGLKNIQELLQTQEYPRLRFGIGNNFPKGRQIDFVLGKWSKEEQSELITLIPKSVEAIESFVLAGIGPTMTSFNK